MHLSVDDSPVTEENLGSLAMRIETCIADLRRSGFLAPLISQLRAGGAYQRAVCLGVGHFATQRAARYQLALALILGEELLGGEDAREEDGVSLFDPMLSQLETEFVRRRARCQLRSTNEEGRISFGGGRALCYIPHCTRQLYSNLLQANWSIAGLGDLVIIGNSFGAMTGALTDAESEASARWCCVTRIAPYVLERNLGVLNGVDAPEFDNAFSSTSIHSFSSAGLPASDNAVWHRQLEEWPYSDVESVVPAQPCECCDHL
jgi:hypothetical protein